MYGNHPNRRSDGSAKPGFGKHRPGGRYNDDIDEKNRKKHSRTMTYEEYQERQARRNEAKCKAQELAKVYWDTYIQPIIDAATDRELAFCIICQRIEEDKQKEVVSELMELAMATPLMDWYYRR